MYKISSSKSKIGGKLLASAIVLAMLASLVPALASAGEQQDASGQQAQASGISQSQGSAAASGQGAQAGEDPANANGSSANGTDGHADGAAPGPSLGDSQAAAPGGQGSAEDKGSSNIREALADNLEAATVDIAKSVASAPMAANVDACLAQARATGEEFRFKVRVGAGDTFSIPTSSTVGAAGFKAKYKWLVFWGDGSEDFVNGTAALPSKGVPHMYTNSGDYEIMIVPDGSTSAWLEAFGFTGPNLGACEQSNKDKVIAILSPLTPLMKRVAPNQPSNASEWRDFFRGCRNLTTTGPGFSGPEWDGITEVDYAFGNSMFQDCNGPAFTMHPDFNLPKDIKKVGYGFAQYMFQGCSGSSFTMNDVFNLPQGITEAGNQFALCMFMNCKGDAFTMNSVFNLPRAVSPVQMRFATQIFAHCAGPSFQVNQVFSFPRVTEEELNKQEVFREAFIGIVALQARTAASIINNPAPSGQKGNMTPAANSLAFHGFDHKAFRDKPVLEWNWGGVSRITLQLDACGGTDGSLTTLSDLYWDTLAAQGISLPKDGDPEAPTMSGKRLLGWATAADPSDPAFALVDESYEVDEAGIALNFPCTETLYAVWGELPQPQPPNPPAPPEPGTSTDTGGAGTGGGSGTGSGTGTGSGSGAGAGAGSESAVGSGSTDAAATDAGGSEAADGLPGAAAAVAAAIEGNAPEATGNADASGRHGTGATRGIQPAGVPFGGIGVTEVWSLLSFLCCALAALAALSSLASVVLMRSRRRPASSHAQGEKAAPQQALRLFAMPVASAVFAAVAVAAWLSYDNISDPLVWVNSNTLAIAFMSAVCIAVAAAGIVFARVTSKPKKPVEPACELLV